MKSIKKVAITATIAAFLVGGSASFTNAATKEDISCLIEETKKTEVLREYHNGTSRKALQDVERIGNEERNIYFGINYREFQDKVFVEDVLVIIDYIKHEGDNLNIKHIAIRDGYGNPDGEPDVVEESRIFERLEQFTYLDDDGTEKTGEVAIIDYWFPKIYDLNESQEKERINGIFDKAVEVFKLKIKETLTGLEKTQYKNLKQEIKDLVLKSEHLQKSKEELMQIYTPKNR